MQPFHRAFPSTDLEATRRFDADVLGCAICREAQSCHLEIKAFRQMSSLFAR